MAKCNYCNQRKGKRSCPALSDLVCNLCCGQHRGKEIRCTADCEFASSKQSYYVQKSEDKFFNHIINFFESIYKVYGEPGKNLMVFIDTKLYEYFYGKSNIRDSEAVSLLDSFRRNLSPVELVVRNESFTDRSNLEELEKFLKYIGMDDDKAIAIFDSYIKQINDYVDEKLDTNIWVRQFINLMLTKNPEMCNQIKAKRSVASKSIIYPWGDAGGTEFLGDDKTVINDGKDNDERKIIIPG